MSVTRCKFEDPVGGGTYTWARNHEAEQEQGLQTNIQATSTTSGNRRIKQQSDDDVFKLTYTGRITVRDQYVQFWFWRAVSKAHTIYFTDFDGQKYEVQITDLKTQRVRQMSAAAGSDPTHHYWTYTIEMTVYRFITGDLSFVTP